MEGKRRTCYNMRAVSYSIVTFRRLAGVPGIARVRWWRFFKNMFILLLSSVFFRTTSKTSKAVNLDQSWTHTAYWVVETDRAWSLRTFYFGHLLWYFFSLFLINAISVNHVQLKLYFLLIVQNDENMKSEKVWKLLRHFCKSDIFEPKSVLPLINGEVRMLKRLVM